MNVYFYKARDKSGKLKKGLLEAKDQNELVDKLHQSGFLVVGVRRTGTGLDLNHWIEKFTPIREGEKLLFYIQFSNLISSGISLLDALKILADKAQNARFKKIISQLILRIESGASLSESLNDQGQVFPVLLTHMVRAGETSGNLADVLARFAKFSEQEMDLRQRVNSALFYPALLSVASAGLIVFITSFVIPNFVKIFQKSNVSLPVSTKILFYLGESIRSYWLLFLIAVILIFIMLKWLMTFESAIRYRDKVKISLPIVGSLFNKVGISRFSRTLATMDASGVPIIRSLEVSKQVIGNVVIASSIEPAIRAVEQGALLAESLQKSPYFPADCVQMIASGENSGSLSQMLFKISDYYDRLIEYDLKKLVSVIEPLFLVIIGSVVAFIMASMLMPLFDLVKVIRAMR